MNSKEGASIQSLSENTRRKVKQVTFKILEQAGIIDSVKNRKIIKPLLNDNIIRYYSNKKEILKGLLMNENEILANIG